MEVEVEEEVPIVTEQGVFHEKKNCNGNVSCFYIGIFTCREMGNVTFLRIGGF